MSRWLRMRSLPKRLLVYAVLATLAFGFAAGAGAIGALMIQGDLARPSGEEPSDEQASAPGPEQEQTASQQREAAGQDSTRQSSEEETSEEEISNERKQAAAGQDETEYVTRVGNVQGKAVKTFLDTHEKLLRYDSLTADDVEKMQVNAAGLGRLADETDNLDPPYRYRQQHETFRSAIDQLHGAASLAYDLAADPTAATQSGFDEYDRLVGGAAVDLQRSNEALGRDYASIEGVQKINPLS